MEAIGEAEARKQKLPLPKQFKLKVASSASDTAVDLLASLAKPAKPPSNTPAAAVAAQREKSAECEADLSDPLDVALTLRRRLLSKNEESVLSEAECRKRKLCLPKQFRLRVAATEAAVVDLTQGLERQQELTPKRKQQEELLRKEKQKRAAEDEKAKQADLTKIKEEAEAKKKQEAQQLKRESEAKKKEAEAKRKAEEDAARQAEEKRK